MYLLYQDCTINECKWGTLGHHVETTVVACCFLFLEDMDAATARPDLVTYSTVMSACDKALMEKMPKISTRDLREQIPQ